ncbi:hypothetical protein B0T16DRAFT_399905 [Cercophora newfieldiana]|uniref:DUF202 domain-containing protein n=1 Tax=Cercophora newfieldiana TaxID=92897 RepID=A0AA39YRM8_9PEZI|nr:hypothetical protein B0T16DRAFT_399905 [Cercophora newfieldiana]
MMADDPPLQPPLPPPAASLHRFPTAPTQPRRRSTQERLNDILEGASERADSLSHSQPGSGAGSPRVGSPRLQPLLAGSPRTGNSYTFPNRLEGAGIREDGSGDESGIVTRQPERHRSLQYQTPTHTSSSPRRRSAVPSRRTSTQNDAGNESDTPGDIVAALQQKEKSEWKKRLEYFQSIELENKGSVARDHLALERTFLAWLRTSLAFASIGIAITQLFRLNTSLVEDGDKAESLRHLGKPLGATFLGISILILFLGYKRYLSAQWWIIRGKFPASRGTIMFMSFITFAVTVASLVVVVTVQAKA